MFFADTSEIAIELVNGRDASASFDMQSLASLNRGDRILVSTLRLLRSVSASAWLELFRYLATKAALERRRLLTMPLQRMTLRDLVVVEALEIDFESGFTALTVRQGLESQF